MTRAPIDDRAGIGDMRPERKGVPIPQEKAHATVRALIIELARIAAAEDDAAERRRDVVTPC